MGRPTPTMGAPPKVAPGVPKALLPLPEAPVEVLPLEPNVDVPELFPPIVDPVPEEPLSLEEPELELLPKLDPEEPLSLEEPKLELLPKPDPEEPKFDPEEPKPEFDDPKPEVEEETPVPEAPNAPAVPLPPIAEAPWRFPAPPTNCAAELASSCDSPK